jgi:23S rRNA-/tRNA-specific pseudouridylate synthase
MPAKDNVPPQPPGSARITLVLERRSDRLDGILLEAMRMQTENKKLREISRSALKALFTQHKVLIKGQPAKPSSSIATGTTYVDILM